MFRRNMFALLVQNEREDENQWLRRQRKVLRDSSNPLKLPERIFQQNYRLSKEAFLYVLSELGLQSGLRSTYVPPILRLCITLEVLASGGYQWIASNDFGISVGQSTLSRIVTETTKEMEEKLCSSWILWKVGESESVETKEYFYRKYKIPGIIGCVDGTHLFFQRPTKDEAIYFNRKGKHSLNAMVICDHKMRIMAINASYPGSAHDSLIWKHSNERAYFESTFIERQHNSWLLGDSGYPLEPWLLTPYRTSSDDQKTKFNKIHAKARNMIERCIGVYKGRWRILLEERKSRYAPEKITCFANVCAALHNICIHFKVEFTPVTTPEVIENIPSTTLVPARLKEIAKQIRTNIKDSL